MSGFEHPSVQRPLERLAAQGYNVQDWMRGYLTYGLPLIVLFIFAFGLYDKFFA